MTKKGASMPRYRGSCGCYNRQDARELGLVPAIVWNDMLDRSEHFNTNPMWYDQKAAATRLGIEYHRLNRAVKTLEEAGRIKTAGGFRPNSVIKTTWITILAEDTDPSEISNSNFRNEQNGDFGNEQNEISILKETKEKETHSEVRAVGTQEDNVEQTAPVVVYFRVNPSGRAWKSVKVYSTEEEVDKLESTNPESNIEFKYWKSPKFVGDDSKAKFKYMKAKLIQPDIAEEEAEYKVVNGTRCKKITYKDASGNEHEGFVRLNTGNLY